MYYGHRHPHHHFCFVEELGIDPSSIEIIGRLDQIISLSGLLVTPFVGVLPTNYEVNLCSAEISDV